MSTKGTDEIEDSALSEASEESIQTGYINSSLPEVVVQLQEKLLGDYILSPPPVEPPVQHTLSRAEELSLQHSLASTDSHGTVKAYSAHAKVLAEDTTVEPLSLYDARKLADTLTGLK